MQYFVTEFPEWKRRLTGHTRELREIANSIDEYHKGATIANVTGSSISAVGGILTIAGLIAAPFTAGVSLVLTGVGAGMGGAGAVTNLTAGITESVQQSQQQKRVAEIIEQYNSDWEKMSERLNDICSVVQFLSQRSELEMTESDNSYLIKAVSQSSSVATKSVTVASSVLAKQMLKKTPGLKELAKKLTALSGNVRNTQYVKETRNVKSLLSGTTLAMSKTARTVAGVASAVFVAWDVYSITTDSIELSKGSKTEVAEKIRNEAQRIEDALKVYEDIYQSLKNVLERD